MQGDSPPGCSLVRSRRRFLRPDLPSSRRSRVSRVKSAVFGGTGATRSSRLGASMARTHDLPRLARGAILWREVVAHRSVTTVSARRLNGGDGVQIEIDHLLKCCRGGAVAQTFRQSFEPLGAFDLHRDHLGQSVVPALASTSPRRPGVFHGERRLSRLMSGAVAGLAFGVAQRGGAFGSTASGHGCSPLRNDDQWDQPAALKRSSERIGNWFLASFQLCGAVPQLAVMLRKASHMSLFAASSVGKWPRVLMILRTRALTLSIALVV